MRTISLRKFFQLLCFLYLSYYNPLERPLEKFYEQMTSQRMEIFSTFFISSFSCAPIDTIFSIFLLREIVWQINFFWDSSFDFLFVSCEPSLTPSLGYFCVRTILYRKQLSWILVFYIHMSCLPPLVHFFG